MTDYRKNTTPLCGNTREKAMKIIHVDMNKYARYAMEMDIPQILPNAELHCFPAPDHALAFAKEHGCDVLMTEVELWTERLGGFRLAKAMKELNPQVKIIFVTVWSKTEISRELSWLQISGFIPKPWSLETLAGMFGKLYCMFDPQTMSRS